MPWISRKRITEIEKRIADLEAQVQSQRKRCFTDELAKAVATRPLSNEVAPVLPEQSLFSLILKSLKA